MQAFRHDVHVYDNNKPDDVLAQRKWIVLGLGWMGVRIPKGQICAWARVTTCVWEGQGYLGIQAGSLMKI